MSTIGRIKWFDSKKGFGFVTNCETNEDIFVHHSKIVTTMDCWKALYPGEYVSYDLDKSDETKTQASNVTGVMGGPLLCETRSQISQQRKEYNDTKPSTSKTDNV
tara:strand:- start:1240 stop:1554 length:315 start_codon:yes stop_codon:yes gene_type:complete